MDFVAVLNEIVPFFRERGIRFAVIGGIGLAGYGLPRATFDLEFVVEGEAQDSVIRFLESLGYRTLHRSTGYSNHEHPDETWGGVDVVYVREPTSTALFEATRSLEGPGGLTVPVPIPDHLIAMKVVAMKNDPKRTFQDMADIQFLLSVPGVDRDQIRVQFEKHGLGDRFRELEDS